MLLARLNVYRRRLTLAGYGPRCFGSVLQSRQHQFVRIRETGFLAADRAHPDTAINTETAFANDAILERPVFLAADLKIEVRSIDIAASDYAECTGEMPLLEAGRRQQCSSYGVQ